MRKLDQDFGFAGVTFRPVGLGKHIVERAEPAGFQHREGFVELAVLAGSGIGLLLFVEFDDLDHRQLPKRR